MEQECLIRLNTDLFEKQSIMKTSYHFIDQFYVFLDQEDKDILVRMVPKSKSTDLANDIEGEFRNELLNQEIRSMVTKDTKNIRELILARAMYSTYLEEPELMQESDGSFNIDAIAKDWFEDTENES